MADVDYTKGMTVPQLVKALSGCPEDCRLILATSYFDDVEGMPGHYSHRVELTLRYPPRPKPEVADFRPAQIPREMLEADWGAPL